MGASVTLSNTYSRVLLDQWTNTLDNTSPTFNRPVSLGVNTPSTTLSGSGTAVRYAAHTYNFVNAEPIVQVEFTWNRVGATGGEAQYRYGAGGFTAATPLANNLGSAFLGASAVGGVLYSISAPAGAMTFVDAWATNTASSGTTTTRLFQGLDAGALVDAGATPGNKDFTVTSASTDTIVSLDSITLRGLQHTWNSDLQFTLSNGVNSILFLANADGADSRDFNGDYTFTPTGAGFAAGGTVLPSGTTGATNDFSATFAGQALAGTWTLSVTDIASGDTGRLEGFDLNFTTVPTPGAAALLGMGGLLAARRRRA
ncbi:hypothetical protein BH11PLA1_BH11PLA1_18120 [soil metagenome]